MKGRSGEVVSTVGFLPVWKCCRSERASKTHVHMVHHHSLGLRIVVAISQL